MARCSWTSDRKSTWARPATSGGLALALVLALMVGTAGAQAPGVTADRVLLGSFQALSGAAAPIGLDMTRGMRTYFQWVNDQGGVHGRTVELLVENDEFRPANTVAAVRKLVEQDQVFAIVGGLGTPTSLAVLDYLVEEAVPFVYQASGVSEFAFPPKRTVFAVQPNYTVEGQIVARYAVEHLGAERVAVIYQNDDIGQEGLAAVRTYLEQQGMAPVAELAFDPGEVDFSSHILRLRQVRPDATIIYAILQPTTSILQTAHRMGLQSTFLTTYVNADLALVSLAGEAAEGLIMTGWVPILDESDPDAAQYLEVFQRYNPDYAGIPSGYVAAGWVAAEIFTEGLRRAGPDLTRERFIEAMEGLDHWNGLIAKEITYGPEQRSGKVSLYFLQVEGGTFVTISDWVGL